MRIPQVGNEIVDLLIRRIYARHENMSDYTDSFAVYEEMKYLVKAIEALETLHREIFMDRPSNKEFHAMIVRIKRDIGG